MIARLPDPTTYLQRPKVLIVGASTRAGAMSALRGGFLPICIDQFADADLRKHAEVHIVQSLSSDDQSHGDTVRKLLGKYPDLPLILGGGMENQPDLIQSLHHERTVWGASPEAIYQVRQPQLLVRGLEEVKQRVLEVSLSTEPHPPADGNWVVKPIASAGGRGITIWDEKAFASPPDEQHFFQRRALGRPHSALFIASCQPGDVRFVGITRQLVGCPQLHAAPFAWCGNIGPAFLSMEAEFLVRRWGNILKWKFGLTGLFGIDFIVDDSGQPWLLEVNPRLTGSVDVLELACGLSLLTDHVECYAPETAAQAREFTVPASEPIPDRLGRAIVYAPRKLISRIPVPETPCWESAPEIADIPEWGTVIEAGQPLCSVYAWGHEESEVEQKLFDTAAQTIASCEPADC